MAGSGNYIIKYYTKDGNILNIEEKYFESYGDANDWGYDRQVELENLEIKVQIKKKGDNHV